MDTLLKLAIQKSGRLTDDSIALLKKCGIKFNRINGKLKAQADNFPIELLFLRNSDIPGYIRDGVADLGIIGDNIIVEKGSDLDVVEKLGFSKCRVSLAVPKSSNINKAEDLVDMNIATSYPNTLQQYFDQKGVSINIHEISGSVEIAPSIGLADAICDIVSSGSTLMSNGLKEIEVILKSEAVLVVNPKLSDDKKEILEQLRFRIQSVNKAKNSKYIMLNAPNDSIDKITSILPGIKSPTVMPLAEDGWSSLHSVIDEDKFWGIIEKLKTEGAEGILVLPIEKMIS